MSRWAGGAWPRVRRGDRWDSTRSLPLAGATVYVSNGESTAVTDASGRFRLTGLPVGSNAIEIPSGGVVGFAEDGATGLPVHGARIEAEWEVRGRWRLRDALRGIGPDKPRSDEIVTDANGRFLVCPFPLGNTLRIRAAGAPRIHIEVDRRLMHANVGVR